MSGERILVLNPGSSSLKASLVEAPDRTLARADVSWGSDASRASERARSIESVLAELGADGGGVEGAEGIDAVGYRVVHGGDRFTSAVLIDEEVIVGIESVRDLAPLHNGVALDTIRAGRALMPGITHVACFDTAFHATLSADAFRYPVPARWYSEWGVRRYGFHGLSVEWSVRRAAELLGQDADDLRLVVAHLGSGCSVTAVDAGRSVDTSMGLTPLEGLMMGTRSGSIDPGAILSVLDRGLLSAAAIAEDLEHGSGLLGVSGVSGDMRELQATADTGDARSGLAIAMFVRRAASAIAAAATSLPTLDALVFTGGIGEHASEVRGSIVARLGVLGVTPLPQGDVDEGDHVLGEEGGSVAVLRVEAREDLVIAAEAADLVPDRS